MCFSATASFIASGVLMTAGLATIKSTKSKKHLVFASIPIFFAVQQFFEGFVWLSLTDPDFAYLKSIFVYSFLIFAQVVWPFFVPASIFLMEKDPKRKKIFIPLMIIGGITSGFLAFCMMMFPLEATIESFHIRYDLNFPEFNINYKGIPYAMATILPAFVSSVKGMKIFGFTILLSLIVTMLFYHEYLISVWCFFAAILSLSILYILKRASMTGDSKKA